MTTVVLPVQHPASGPLSDATLSRSGRTRSAIGTANGTFGELLQGSVLGEEGDGSRFLVTLPVARWSLARFDASDDLTDITVTPDHKKKSVELARRLLRHVGVECGGHLTIDGSLPEGKGLASSSADLVATGRAVMTAVGATVAPDTLGALMAGIEPTDGVQHSGVVAYDHRIGRHRASLGHLPPLQIIALDEGGAVDTVTFNQREVGFPDTLRREYGRLLDRLAGAVRQKDLAAVGAIASRSADLNQRLLPHRHLTAMKRICRSVGGLGIVACHSGTMLGLLLDPSLPDYRSRLRAAVEQCQGLNGKVHLIRTLTGP